MKIETKISRNYFKIYSEARGIANHREKIIKEKKVNVLTFFEELALIFSFFFILGLLIIKIFDKYHQIYGYTIIILDFIFFISCLLRFYASYQFRKKQFFISMINVDEKGITDVSSFPGTEILFTWDKIEGVVIKKYSIVILTKSMIYFYFDIKYKEKILNAIRTYQKDILLIFDK